MSNSTIFDRIEDAYRTARARCPKETAFIHRTISLLGCPTNQTQQPIEHYIHGRFRLWLSPWFGHGECFLGTILFFGDFRIIDTSFWDYRQAPNFDNELAKGRNIVKFRLSQHPNHHPSFRESVLLTAILAELPCSTSPSIPVTA